MNGNGGWFRKFETALDNAQSGPLWLKDERIVKEVAESLRYRDGKVYRLDAYCIMANHVHAVFAPLAIQPSGEAQTNRLRYRSPRRIGTVGVSLPNMSLAVSISTKCGRTICTAPRERW